MFLEFGALRHRNTELGVQKFTMIFGYYGCQHISRYRNQIIEIQLCKNGGTFENEIARDL